METKKIAIACFIGGALCSAVALLFAPAFWWLGLIAGFAGGYISYEFQGVREAIPFALELAGEGVNWLGKECLDFTRSYLAKPHPFGYLAAGIISPLAIFLATEFPQVVRQRGWIDAIMGYVMLLVLLWVVGAVLSLIFMAIAVWGAESENCSWTEDPNKLVTLSGDDHRIEMITYSGIYRWMAIGVGQAILFFLWRMWKYAAVGAYIAVKYTGRFLWFLFKLIHSEKRVLCGVDGMLGGFASYIWLAPSTQTFIARVMLVLFGGLLGTAFGVLNWEIVSKRILHVQDAPSV